MFRIDSSIHFISRLLTAIFPTTNHLATFAASVLFFFLSLFSPPLFIFINPSSLPIYTPTCLPPSTTPYPTYHPTVAPLSNWSTKRGRYRESVSSEDRAEEEELNRVRVHTSPCECTPFQPRNANDLLAYRHKVLAISDRLYVTYS